MSIHRKLLHLFPDYKEGDWTLQDDGVGPYIKEWRRADAKPSQAAINAVSDTDADNAKETQALKRAFEVSKRDKAIIKWIADLHGLTPAQARIQLRAIWRQLN